MSALADYERVVLGGAAVELGALDSVAAGREAMLALLAGGASAYGVTTGLGRLASAAIEPDAQGEFQRALLLRGAGQDPPLPAEVVRGAMLLRLRGFQRGHAGVSVALCRFIAARLDDGFTPVVPSRGVSGAGEVVALSHLFQTFVGAGEVLEGDARVPAAEALRARGAAPYAPQVKEGIALVNGAVLAPALAARLVRRARGALEHATLAGALVLALTGASLRPYSRRIATLSGDAAQARVHEDVLAWHADGERWDDRPQAPVSFRVMPQVHGAVLGLLDDLAACVERALGGVSDSPLVLGADGSEPAGFYPSGGFHAEALGLRIDALGVGVAQLTSLAATRLHRMLDARFSALTEQLARSPGRDSGLVFLHKAALGYVAENRMLAAPASVHSGDASAGQEDVQTLVFLAAEQLERALDNLELVLASELIAARQARHIAGAELPPRLERVVEQLASVVEPVEDDRTLSDDVARVRELIASCSLLDREDR